jgi:hypothetical protein
MRELASDLKALKEDVRHLDVKLDMLQEGIEELVTSFRLSERLTEAERALKAEKQSDHR